MSEDKHSEMTALVTWMRANGVTKFAVDGMEIEVDLYYPFSFKSSWPLPAYQPHPFTLFPYVEHTV